jgi:hypothetical protein
MPTSAAYQATYVEPTVGGAFTSPLGKWRYKVAGALCVLQQKLREGNAQTPAQAYLSANPPNLLGPVKQAAADLNNQAILTDFQAIDSL